MLIKDFYSPQYSIGLVRKPHYSTLLPEFFWDDLTPVDFVNWRAGEEPPETFQTLNSDCVAMNGRHAMGDDFWWEQTTCVADWTASVCERNPGIDGEVRKK